MPVSNTEFATALSIAAKMDAEQKDDLLEFMTMEPKAQQLVLKFADKSKVTMDIKDGHLKGTARKKSDIKTPYKGSRLKIVAPQGCKLDYGIPFSYDGFSQWLVQKGLTKSTAYTYSVAIRSLLKQSGLHKLDKMSILTLKTVKDTISGPSKSDMNYRSKLKKFNEYLNYAFAKQEKAKA